MDHIPSFSNDPETSQYDFTYICDHRSVQNCTAFCTSENIDQCLAYLSQEFVALGFPSIYTTSSRDHLHTSNCDIVKYINSTYELLHLYHNHVRCRDELERRNLRLSSDIDMLYSNQSHLKNSIEQSERKCASVQERERQSNEKLKVLQSQLKIQKDEVKKLTSILQKKQMAYHHELKKKEREINQLKEKLHQVLTDKNSDKKCARIDILNTLPRCDRQRGKWKTGSSNNQHVEELYNSIISNYETRHQEQVQEITSLCECLRFVHDEIASVVNQQKDTDETSKSNCDKVSSVSKLPNDLLHLAHGFSSKQTKEVFEEQLKFFKDLIEKQKKDMQDTGAVDKNLKEQELVILKEKIKHYEESLEHKQEKEQVVTQNDESKRDMKDMSVQTIEIEVNKDLLPTHDSWIQEKNKLDEKKKELIEYAAQLGKEKQALENDKLEFLRSQMMQCRSSGFQEQEMCFSPAAVLTTRDGQISVPNAHQLHQVPTLDDSLFGNGLPKWLGASSNAEYQQCFQAQRPFHNLQIGQLPDCVSSIAVEKSISSNIENDKPPKWSLSKGIRNAWITGCEKQIVQNQSAINESHEKVLSSLVSEAQENDEFSPDVDDASESSSSDEQNLERLRAAFAAHSNRHDDCN